MPEYLPTHESSFVTNLKFDLQSGMYLTKFVNFFTYTVQNSELLFLNVH